MAEDLEITTCSKCGGKGFVAIPWLDWILWQLGKLLYPYVKEYGE